MERFVWLAPMDGLTRLILVPYRSIGHIVRLTLLRTGRRFNYFAMLLADGSDLANRVAIDHHYPCTDPTEASHSPDCSALVSASN